MLHPLSALLRWLHWLRCPHKDVHALPEPGSLVAWAELVEEGQDFVPLEEWQMALLEIAERKPQRLTLMLPRRWRSWRATMPEEETPPTKGGC